MNVIKIVGKLIFDNKWIVESRNYLEDTAPPTFPPMPPPTTLLFSMWSCFFLGPVDFRIIIPHLLTVLSLLKLCPFVH